MRAARPRQWSKNALVLAAPCAAGAITRSAVALSVALAATVFCMLSSATYLLNDVRDVEQDRLHPRKRLRPVAAGDLSKRAALSCGAALAVTGLVLAFAVAPLLALVGCGYLALTASYSLWWRSVVVLDIAAIAGGFVLRTVAGGAAGAIPLSRSFLVVAGCGAVFLVAGKRFAELRDSPRGRVARATLRRYSPGSLRALLLTSAAAAGAAYTLWALRGPGHGVWHIASIAPFALWLARYGVLLGRGAGQSPEETIAHDRLLLGLSAMWTALFLCGVYAGR